MNGSVNKASPYHRRKVGGFTGPQPEGREYEQGTEENYGLRANQVCQTEAPAGKNIQSR